MDLGHGYTGQHRAMGNTSRALLANKDGYKSWAKFENSSTELVGIYVSNFARKLLTSKSCRNPTEAGVGFRQW